MLARIITAETTATTIIVECLPTTLTITIVTTPRNKEEEEVATTTIEEEEEEVPTITIRVQARQITVKGDITEGVQEEITLKIGMITIIGAVHTEITIIITITITITIVIITTLWIE